MKTINAFVDIFWTKSSNLTMRNKKSFQTKIEDFSKPQIRICENIRPFHDLKNTNSKIRLFKDPWEAFIQIIASINYGKSRAIRSCQIADKGLNLPPKTLPLRKLKVLLCWKPFQNDAGPRRPGPCAQSLCCPSLPLVDPWMFR